MEEKTGKFLFWTPRILSILFILFLMVFSLDVFEMELSFWETVVGLFMHNIPALVLLIVLLVSWKREIIGGIVFILAGTLYAAIILYQIIVGRLEAGALFWSLIISGPALIVGALFLINWLKKKKEQKSL